MAMEASAQTSKDKRLNRSLLVRIGKRLRKRFNRVIARSSLVGDAPVLDPKLFPWIPALEAEWPAIAEEARAMLRHRDAIPPLNEVSPDHQRLAGSRKWRSFFLWGYGFRVDENCARAPATTRAVERIPGLKTALFSIHEPGMHIPPHKGVTKAICVLHLGLAIPKDGENCRIRVVDHVFGWEEGRAFVFDDTREHEVWNRTDEDRVILLVQFDRPLRFPGSWAARAFMAGVRWSPFVQDARANMAAWEKAFQKLEKAEE